MSAARVVAPAERRPAPAPAPPPGQRFVEYALDGAGLGLFLLSAMAFATLLEHPASPVHQALPDALLRRGLMGLAMGATAVALIYSPWGRRSGAHLNPATTLAFWRLGHVPGRDLAGYVAGQFVGAAAGAALAALVAGPWVAHPAVHFVVTRPGLAGPSAAFVAEVAITALLVSVVVRISARPRLEPYTGVVAGALVAAFITLEAPVSGMSMNPARTLASALVAGDFTALWLYFAAPPLGALLAAELWRAECAGRDMPGCAKLRHDPAYPCLFCGQPGERGGPGSPPLRLACGGAGLEGGAPGPYGAPSEAAAGRTPGLKMDSSPRPKVALVPRR